MLKTQTLELTGRDEGLRIVIRELPALEADRHARALLEAADCDPDGGIVALAFRDLATVRKSLGAQAPYTFECFVNHTRGGAPQIHDWRNIERIQNAALALHAGFAVDRKSLEMPVKMQAAMILHGGADARVTFCSPFIAAVINSKYASYVELETVLSTEDAFNLSEIVTINALRDFTQAERDATT